LGETSPWSGNLHAFMGGGLGGVFVWGVVLVCGGVVGGGGSCTAGGHRPPLRQRLRPPQNPHGEAGWWPSSAGRSWKAERSRSTGTGPDPGLHLRGGCGSGGPPGRDPPDHHPLPILNIGTGVETSVNASSPTSRPWPAAPSNSTTARPSREQRRSALDASVPSAFSAGSRRLTCGPAWRRRWRGLRRINAPDRILRREGNAVLYLHEPMWQRKSWNQLALLLVSIARFVLHASRSSASAGAGPAPPHEDP